MGVREGTMTCRHSIWEAKVLLLMPLCVYAVSSLCTAQLPADPLYLTSACRNLPLSLFLPSSLSFQTCPFHGCHSDLTFLAMSLLLQYKL